MRHVIKLFADVRGLAAIDYGLGIALVAIVSITAWGAAGNAGTAPQPAAAGRLQPAA